MTMKKILNLSKKIGRLLVRIWKGLALALGSLLLFLMLVIIVFIIAVDGSGSSWEAKTTLRKGSEQQIAYVKLYGEIVQMSDDSLLGFNPFVITPSRARRVFSHLEKADPVKAVVIEINSPGGSVAASEEVYQQIKKLAQVKPVVVHFADVAASGGYYIALPADKIVANIPSLTGSIGVIAFNPNLSGLYDKLGIQIETYQTGPYKDLGSPNRSATQAEKEIMDSVIADSYQLFVDRIVQERGLEEEQVLALADGRIYSGQQAVDNGLVDEIGDLDHAFNLARQLAELDDPSIIEYQTGPGIWAGLLSSSSLQLPLTANLTQDIMPPKMGLYYLWRN